MSKQVSLGDPIVCNFGTTPSVILTNQAMVLPAYANIMDFQPLVNIPPFSLCTCMGNPLVTQASAVAGTLVPMPCSPATQTPWTPGNSKLVHRGAPTLNSYSILRCAYGGVITILSAESSAVMV